MLRKFFRALLALVFVSALMLLVHGCSKSNTPYTAPPPPPGQGSNSVSIVDYAFQPNALTVDSGMAVTWTNNSTYTTHTVTSNTGLFDATLSPGATFRYTFNMKGTFGYHCKIHPTMTASITSK